ncbi:aldolase/citrate lyase family protein [Spartinivicinus poritis]|uniref:Aldolase/citrate lyase family protein n=1 Tax=Spartinivicinus poritis TaxID=2994640 RepID=A0ABT5U7W7_9GAMM|nr:aldolase/citrate lyase family protein [Spartinivicinus sp. A2-2]MDE1461607.1 aldolase/citrate lyase family protein [Spartinivicinus sp. A2-2]
MKKHAEQLYYRLGATLYMPAIRPDLAQKLTTTQAGSVVLCTEDAISESQIEEALKNINKLLMSFPQINTNVFIRARSPQVLANLLALDTIDQIKGFVIPKIDHSNVHEYKEAVEDSGKNAFYLMPTIETEIAFDNQELIQLRKFIDTFPVGIPCFRIGGNDLLSLLGIKRPDYVTIYETPVRIAIDNCITAFRPFGYQLSAPVFEYIDDKNLPLLKKELMLDRAYGFLNKTAIHPVQVDLIQEILSVKNEELDLAKKIILHQDKAVFKADGQMCEPSTHINWAKKVLAIDRR